MRENISKKKLREFGYIIAFGFPIIIGWIIPAISGHLFRSWTLWIGFSSLFVGILKPNLLFYPYVAWMNLGYILGWVNSKIILDPGIGFGKNLKHNLTLISKISLFHSLGFPILVGTSRKRFINQISGKYDSKDRTGGTLASVLFLLSQGVQIFRVHNVKEVKQGILVFKKIISN